MQHKKNYSMGTIGDLYFIHNAHPIDFPSANEILTTNETGAFLWETLDSDISLDELTEIFAKYYEIDRKTAKQDIMVFLNSLKKISAIEDR